MKDTRSMLRKAFGDIIEKLSLRNFVRYITVYSFQVRLPVASCLLFLHWEQTQCFLETQ